MFQFARSSVLQRVARGRQGRGQGRTQWMVGSSSYSVVVVRVAVEVTVEVEVEVVVLVRVVELFRRARPSHCMLLLVNHLQDHHRHHHQHRHHLLYSSSSYPPNPQTTWYWPPTCSTSGYFEPNVGQSQALPSVPAAVIKCQSDLPPPQIRPPWPTNRTSLAPPFRKRPLPEIQCQQIFTESGNDSEIIFTCGLTFRDSCAELRVRRLKITINQGTSLSVGDD